MRKPEGRAGIIAKTPSRKKILSLSIYFLVFLVPALGQSAPETKLKWHDARNFTVEGKGWAETVGFYERLPARAEKLVRPEVWKLSKHSAGISVSFVTDAASVSARWKLRSSALALPNMTAMAASGVDLYVKDAGKWRWAGAGKADKSAVNEQKIIDNLPRREREYLLYLPLYNGADSLEIGLPDGATASAARPRPKGVKPVVFYGTSIVQGASASRAGLAYPSILGRKLNRPVVNLGFSGNGRMEAEIAELLTEIDAAAYVIDCLPNLSSGAEVADRTPRLVEILRRKRPATPVILIENIKYPDVFIEQRKNRIYLEKNAALRRVYGDLTLKGIKNLYYIKGDDLIGNDGEATIDGVHPTDLGFVRMAGVIEPILRKILNSR